jgi:hypothetical protein
MEGEEMRRAAERLRDVVQMEVRKGGTSDKIWKAVANGLKAKLIDISSPQVVEHCYIHTHATNPFLHSQ